MRYLVKLLMVRLQSLSELAAIYYDKLSQVFVVQCSELCFALIRDT